MSIREFYRTLAEAQDHQEYLEIETTSSGTAEELLKRTDNGAQNESGDGTKLSWGSTQLANSNGYCQHATRIDDPKHLSHYNNGKDFTIT